MKGRSVSSSASRYARCWSFCHKLYSLNLLLKCVWFESAKDKAAFILYFSFCQLIPWKHQSKQCVVEYVLHSLSFCLHFLFRHIPVHPSEAELSQSSLQTGLSCRLICQEEKLFPSVPTPATTAINSSPRHQLLSATHSLQRTIAERSASISTYRINITHHCRGSLLGEMAAKVRQR